MVLTFTNKRLLISQVTKTTKTTKTKCLPSDSPVQHHQLLLPLPLTKSLLAEPSMPLLQE
jgi:hypothetical protein